MFVFLTWKRFFSLEYIVTITFLIDLISLAYADILRFRSVFFCFANLPLRLHLLFFFLFILLRCFFFCPVLFISDLILLLRFLNPRLGSRKRFCNLKVFRFHLFPPIHSPEASRIAHVQVRQQWKHSEVLSKLVAVRREEHLFIVDRTIALPNREWPLLMCNISNRRTPGQWFNAWLTDFARRRRGHWNQQTLISSMVR